MIYPVESDIVFLIRNIVQGLQPFSKAQNVKLSFESTVPEFILLHDPEKIIADIVSITCRVISFTPQEHTVGVVFNYKKDDSFCTIEIHNTGINLQFMQEIVSGLTIKPSVSGEANQSSSFVVKLKLMPIDLDAERSPTTSENRQLVPKFYAEIRKRLESYFTNADHQLARLAITNPKDAVFLQKVNALIITNLDNEDFDTHYLSEAMNMSRIQLFRRLKPIIRQPPATYIKMIRLQKARELLETTDVRVNEVAFKTGFESPSHFTREFTRQFGVNPSTYTKQKK